MPAFALQENSLADLVGDSVIASMVTALLFPNYSVYS